MQKINNIGFKESDVIEFKAEFDKKNDDILKEIVAFLNARGGVVYVGVKDNGDILGVKNYKKDMDDIKNKIWDKVLPTAKDLCYVSYKEIFGKYVVIIEIKPGDNIFYIKDKGRNSAGCYIRAGSSSMPMDDSDIDKRYLESIFNKKPQLKDREIVKNDLTFEIFKIKLISNKVHINESKFLTNYNLITNTGRYNMLADLISDENFISLAVCQFRGKDKTNYLGRTEFGNKSLLQAYQDALNYCMSLNTTYIDVSVRPRREKKMFDNKAFEEAWINACVHNRWELGIPPQIYIFDDRMEIESQGPLPLGMTKEDFLLGVSRPVNPDLMEIFRACNIVEKSGHGVPEVVKKYGKKAYKFGTSRIVVTIPFDKIGYTTKELESMEKNDLLLDLLLDPLLDSHDDLQYHNLIEEKIIELIKKKNTISRKEMAQLLDLSVSTLGRIIKKSNLIKYIKIGKKSYWQIINEPENEPEKSENEPENEPEKFYNLESKIVQLIKTNNKISKTEMSKSIGVSLSTIKRIITNSSKIKHVGPAKGGYWEIIEDKKTTLN